MEGIVLRVKLNGNLVREVKYPSSLSKEWTPTPDATAREAAAREARGGGIR